MVNNKKLVQYIKRCGLNLIFTDCPERKTESMCDLKAECKWTSDNTGAGKCEDKRKYRNKF